MRTHFSKSVVAGVLAFGLGVILAQAGPPPTPQGVITAKIFLNIGGGTAVTDLTGNAKFPNSPDLVQYPTYFELYATGDINTQADRKSTRLNSSHLGISYAVFCLK